MSHISVAILVPDDFITFHLSVPIMLFGEILKGQKLFSQKLCAQKPGLIWSSEHTAINAEYGLEAFDDADIIIVPVWKHVDIEPSDEVKSALIKANKKGTQIVGLCCGSFVLAYSGILDGKCASTHWQYEQEFVKLFPKVSLNVNSLYVESGNIVTSAGTASALDCCLHVIRKRLGIKIANQIARRMVIPPYRSGCQAQYRETIVPKTSSDIAINELLTYLTNNLSLSHSIDTLASMVNMSRRTLTRHFHDATGMSIVMWLTDERIRVSLELLESSNHSIERIAQMIGFQSASTFRQQFFKKMKVSPTAYRKTFKGNGS